MKLDKIIVLLAFTFIAWILMRGRAMASVTQEEYYKKYLGGEPEYYDDGVNGRHIIKKGDDDFVPYKCANGKANPTSLQGEQWSMYNGQYPDWGLDSKPKYIFLSSGRDKWYLLNPCK